jgi:hypothetical protein
MKYLEALKVFNKNKEWCSPRKGTADHAKVMLIMRGNNAPLPSSSATSMATTKSPSVKSASSATRAPSIKSNVAQGSSIQSFKAQTIPKPPKPPKPSPARVKELKAKGKALIAQRKADATAVLQGVVRRKIAVRPAKSSSTPQMRSSLRRLQIQLYNDNLSQTQIVNGTASATTSSSQGVSSIPNLSSTTMSIMKSSSKKPKTAELQFKNANVIQGFLKNKLVLSKYNLQTRIQRYNLIRKRLEQLDEKNCLTKKVFRGHRGYTIDGFVDLEKKIGSNSAYGAIYLTSMPLLLGTHPIASKVMEITTDNECETKMNEWIAENILIPKHSKHFVFMYKTTKCPFYESQNKRLRKEERLVDYNELCNGDLSALMKTAVRNDEETMLNLAFQVLIAVATYQNRIGYAHQDTHHGNFLYQENNEVGHYHYIYNGLDFYIKSCKYNMLIFDFGLSDSIDKVDNNRRFKDYVRVSMSFISKKANGIGWIDDDMDANVSQTMYQLMDKLAFIMGSKQRIRDFDFFQAVIDEVFKKYKTNTGVFTTAKPAKILNEIPFVINKVGAYPKINFGRSSNLLQAMMRR